MVIETYGIILAICFDLGGRDSSEMVKVRKRKRECITAIE